MENLNQEITRNNIIDMRKSHNYSQKKLAELTDIDQFKLNFIITGKSNKDSAINYGLNYFDLCYLKAVTGLVYVDIFRK